MSTCHLIGNGSSKTLYQYENGDHTYLCNMPTPHLNSLGTFVRDRAVANLYLDGTFSAGQIFCDESVASYLKMGGYGGRVLPYLPQGANVGIQAVQYLANHYQTIELWGFDSLCSGSLESEMGDHILFCPDDEHDIQAWAVGWHRDVLNQFPNNEFILNKPSLQGFEKIYLKEMLKIRH